MKRLLLVNAVAALSLLTACAGPGPRLVSIAPRETVISPDGRVEDRYDGPTGKIDYAEERDATGRVTVLRFDTDGDGRLDLDVPRGAVGPQDRHLIILVDSVPFEIVSQLHAQGRFRLFAPPSRTISPFPVMTDLSFAEFFGVTPCPGAESEFYDGRALEDGYGNYVHETNAPWLARTNYHLINIAHAVAYFRPDAWFDHELHYIQKYFMRGEQSPFIGYCVGSSALGAKLGRSGHVGGLLRLDRMCQQLMKDTRGKLQITLLSDHGHNLVPSRRVPLTESLERMGYRVNSRLKKPGDIVVPEFGVVTCAAIYTGEPQRVAQDVVLLEGVEQAAYLSPDDQVVVLSREGLARIARRGETFRYLVESGDPLKMNDVWQKLVKEGRADADGFVSDAALFGATIDHEYPDAVARLWRAFHGLMVHTPDVMLTVRDGWHCGSKFMTAVFNLQAAHGNLGGPGSCGFAMTTCGPLPPVMRMNDLAQALRTQGVPLKTVPAWERTDASL